MKIYDFHGKKNLCGAQVKLARVRLGITQTELAARLQVLGARIEQDGVSRIELGTRFVADYELLLLCMALKVDVEWLMESELYRDLLPQTKDTP